MTNGMSRPGRNGRWQSIAIFYLTCPPVQLPRMKRTIGKSSISCRQGIPDDELMIV